MKTLRILVAALLIVGGHEAAVAQKTVGDLTLNYELAAGNNQHLDSNIITSASKTLLIRGGMSKSTMVFNGFSQSIIYNQNGEKAYVLYHLNDQDYMSVLSQTQWENQYRKYKDMKVQLNAKDTKTILGYRCIKAVASLKDGTQINMYYTPELKTTVGDNPYEFKQIPGLILEYEAQVMHKYKITFTATKIDFGPVPAAAFIIPKEGYRLLDPNMLKQND
jgi:GLPGLI family protein